MEISSKDHVAVDVLEDDGTMACRGRLDESLLKDDDNTSITEKLKTKMDARARVLSTDGRPTIYRVPDVIRELGRDAYEPQVISLGPYHHGKPHLNSMDEIKWEYLNRFLSRNSSVGLDMYVCLVKDLKTQIRNAYSEAPPCEEAKDHQFIEMMLLDACFVLEFVFNEEQAAPDNGWKNPFVYMDMIRLENQIPFFLLKELLQLNRPNAIPSLTKTIYDVFWELMPGKIRFPSDDPDHYHHILHLLVSCAAPDQSAEAKQPPVDGTHELLELEPEEPTLEWIPCARRLHESGVVFMRKKKSKYQSFLDITFEQGAMEIPPLQIFAGIMTVFRNLIAFEQCPGAPDGAKDHVTAYACIMNFIIDTPRDVEMLDGIIVSSLGNDDDIARLFNTLRMSMPIPSESYLSGVQKSIKDHCEQGCNKCMATLRHNYFSNPWAWISVMAAIVLFLLTTMQTILAFLSYRHPT